MDIMYRNKPNRIVCFNVIWILCLTLHSVTPATIKIAWLCTKAPVFIGFNASTNIGALSYSLEMIQNDSALLPGYDFELRYADSACSSKNSIGELTDLIQNGYTPDLVVGPLCSAALLSSGLLGSELNIPTFGWISSDPSVQNKTEYSTLVRLLWPVLSIGEGIVLLMKEFSWRRVFIISTVGGDYGELAKGVRDVISNLASEGFITTNWERNIQENPDHSTITSIYRQVKQEARIVILSVPESEIRDWMLGVYSEEMHNGDYVFIYINQQTPDQQLVDSFTSLDFWQRNDGNDDNVRLAYENLFMLFAKMNNFTRVEQFLADFNTSAWTTDWASNISLTPSDPDFYSLFMYDAMMVYARVATEVIAEGGSLSNGTALFEKAQSSVTQGGATGDIIMDHNADRIPDYWLFDMQGSGMFAIAAETISSEVNASVQRQWQFILQPRWGDGTSGIENAPLDVPVCGFDNENCPPTTIYIAVGVTLGVLVVIIVIGLFIMRKIQYEKQLKDMSWRVDYKNVHIYKGKTTGFGSMANMQSRMTISTSQRSLQESLTGQKYTTIANYRGSISAVKPIRKSKVEITRTLLQEMKQMVELTHNNLNVFIGACLDAPHVCVLWEYCSKGSLQDVIGNDHINLEEMFKFSVLIDILKGLEYIHGSDLGYHGDIRSSNVVIDGRWIAKLTDFGLHILMDNQEKDEEASEDKLYGDLYWTAPEVLQIITPLKAGFTPSSKPGSKQGDMYSIGILMKEIFCKNEPYEEYEREEYLTTKEIIDHVKQDNNFRPKLEELEHTDSSKETVSRLKTLMCSCWSSAVIDRPTVHSSLKICMKINPSKKSSVLDNMITMMEQYSEQLESKVAIETETLQVEKERSETLLLKMLPRSVVEELKQGKRVEAEAFHSVTIYFSDIPGFSKFASQSTPVQVVDLLNSVYSLMDSTILQYDVYKVETVGDVYVLVSGLPERHGDKHIVHICDCALDILSGTASMKLPSIPDYSVQLRIGIHTGPIVAGVVGLAMPRYCLFGDTINTSSRMESHGAAMRIHMSQFSFHALSKYSGYKLADRGKISVKGKGELNTYWLLGRDDFTKKLPNFSAQFEKDTEKPTILPVTQGKSVTQRCKVPSLKVNGIANVNISINNNKLLTDIEKTTKGNDDVKLSPNSAKGMAQTRTIEISEKVS